MYPVREDWLNRVHCILRNTESQPPTHAPRGRLEWQGERRGTKSQNRMDSLRDKKEQATHLDISTDHSQKHGVHTVWLQSWDMELDWPPGTRQGGKWLETGKRTLRGVGKTPYLTSGGGDMHLSCNLALVKIHWTIHTERVNLIVCELYLNKSDRMED